MLHLLITLVKHAAMISSVGHMVIATINTQTDAHTVCLQTMGVCSTTKSCPILPGRAAESGVLVYSTEVVVHRYCGGSVLGDFIEVGVR